MVSKNRDEGNMPRFFNIKEFYQSCNFGFLTSGGFLLLSSLYFISKSSYDLCRYFRFFLNFSTSWKSWVKEQWPKISLFSKKKYLTAWFVSWGQKRGGIYLSSSNPDYWPSPQRTHKVVYALIQFLVNKSWA